MTWDGLICGVCGTREFKHVLCGPARTKLTSDCPKVAAQLARRGELDVWIEHPRPRNTATCEFGHETRF